MNGDIIHLGCILAIIIPITYTIMFVVKYYYISTVCREWNKKLYLYARHVDRKKSSGKLKNDYKYLEDMYLFPDEVRIYVFKNWKESDLITDKFTLFNVNEYYHKRKKHNNEKS